MKKITLSASIYLIFFFLLQMTAYSQVDFWWERDINTGIIHNRNDDDVWISNSLGWNNGTSFLSNDQFGSIELGQPSQRCTPYIDFRSKEVPLNEDFNVRIINSANNLLDFVTSHGSKLTLNGNPNVQWGIPSLKLSNIGPGGNSLQFQNANGLLAIDCWRDGESGVMDFYADYQNNPTYCQFSIKSNGNCGWGNDWSWLSNEQGGSIQLNKTGLDDYATPFIDFSYGYDHQNHRDVRLINSNPNTLDFFTDMDYNGNGGTKIMSVKNDGVYAKKITVQASWSDFVFKPEYKLRPLAEVEKYIIDNGHLEGIPDENEVSENGVDLGDMSSKLLQKIEELSLYVIDLNKQVELLKKENEDIKEILKNK